MVSLNFITFWPFCTFLDMFTITSCNLFFTAKEIYLSIFLRRYTIFAYTHSMQLIAKIDMDYSILIGAINFNYIRTPKYACTSSTLSDLNLIQRFFNFGYLKVPLNSVLQILKFHRND